MKRFLYIGKENGKEVLIETEMEQPEFLNKSSWENLCLSENNYVDHIKNAPRIEVIGTIPAYWKKGEEVDIEIQYQFNNGKSWRECSIHDYDWAPVRRIVAIPIDKAVEPEHIADTGKMIEEDDFWKDSQKVVISPLDWIEVFNIQAECRRRGYSELQSGSILSNRFTITRNENKTEP
jgi:hypothetical protein